jgi:hypothetical protein
MALAFVVSHVDTPQAERSMIWRTVDPLLMRLKSLYRELVGG